jgi:hypothetical protein
MRYFLAIFWLCFILLAAPTHTISYTRLPDPTTTVEEPARPSIKEYAQQMTIKTFGGYWVSMEAIIAKESHNWRVTGAHYPSGYTKGGVKSSAYGLCGFLNATWKGTGYIKTKDPYKQVDACLIYVKDRYGNPQKALSFHTKHNWF